MKRPLALVGLVFLISMFVAVHLASGALVFLALLFCICAAICVGLCKNHKASIPALVLSVSAFAFLWRFGYDAIILRPISAFEGRVASAQMQIMQTSTGFGEDSINASAKVVFIDGEKAPIGMKVQLTNLPSMQVGSVIKAELEFYKLSGISAARQKGKAFYVGANVISAIEQLEYKQNFLVAIRRLQYVAGENIAEKLPQRLGGVAAAMAVGDKRFLPKEASKAYRAAGISHLLVVSGLHMAVVSGAIYSVLSVVFRKRRKFATLLSILAVLLFMALTGFTLSVVRSGVMCLLMLCASLFKRKADALTSIGFAALVLCLQNPYAAADVGLLLSFTATFGAIISGKIGLLLRRKWQQKMQGMLRVFWQNVLQLLLTSVGTALASFPVLVYAGYAVSLWAVPINIIAVPLLSVILPFSFLMALPSAVLLLNAFAQVGALVVGFLLAFLEKLSSFCEGFKGGNVSINGAYALLVVLVVYFLCFMAFKTKRYKIYLPFTVLVLALAVVLSTVLGKGLVRITVVGVGQNSSLLLSQNGQAVVIYRGRQTAQKLQEAMQAQNAQECVLFVDLRSANQSTEYISLFKPKEIVIVQEDIISGKTFAPLQDVAVYLKKQAGGTAAILQVGAYKIGINSGQFTFEALPPIDMLVAGGGKVIGGQYEILVIGNNMPEWASKDARILQNIGQAEIVIRPNKSIIFREALDGYTQ